MGNLLFLCGVALTIGPSATARFFMRRKNLKGSAFFLGGLILVLIKWAIVGVILETYGFWLLFSGFFPTALGFLRRLPVLGTVLDMPGLKM
eukprot:jgi/Astpho2/5905/gw1.00080.143.1_t